ncbi:MAG: hypothetical protein AAGA58_09185 [Verrucomicrobiota bacterium]
MIASLTFIGGPWAWAGAALACVGGLLAIVGHRRRLGAPKVPLALRLVALGLLALCLAEPSWISEEADPGANIVAVVADTSVGMSVRDSGSKRTRGEDLAALLSSADGEEKWLEDISETFALRRFTVDDRLRRVSEFNELNFDGTASALGGALESVRRRFANRPVAGVILLTDGNSTDGLDAANLKELPPIYPVVIGEAGPKKDLAITDAAVSQSSFEDAPLTVRTDVAVRGFKDKPITVKLLNGEGKTVESEEFTPKTDSDSRSLRFLHRPTGRGVQFFKVEIVAGNEDDAAKEATTANNSRLLAVNRGRGPYRVLYVCGRPNWEYKFLNRSLRSDDELELAGLIRVARREPKFQWRGNQGDGNRLFRGFDPGDDTTELDKPVLIRLGTRTNEELIGGFPREAEELFEYHAVILDDLERSFFTVDQLDLIDAFVSRRGGSLMMLGGAESFQNGGYEKTAVAKMLPVHLGTTAKTAPSSSLQLDLTRDGWLSPWMRLRTEEGEERRRIAEMTPFKSVNVAAGIKPGATVLATIDDDGTRRPALTAQRFGKGRSAALLVADLWRWGFSEAENRPDMEKAWRQLVRWLVADVPERVSVKLEAAGDGAVKAVVRAFDKSFEPLADARVKLTIQSGENEAAELNASPSDTEAGVFEATFVPEGAGKTLVQAVVTDAGGEEIGEAADGWASNGAADEFKRLEPNRALLQSIADETGAEVLNPDDLRSFAKRLPELGAPETRTKTRSLWHTPYVFLLVMACFAAEWTLRRRAGMA